jgi:hypothetical protein
VLGPIDIARLNFGILSLIPKLLGADQFTQFRPIALINVIFKIVAKAYASRLDPVSNRIISPNQTAFIKGRNILDGPLALIEIIHELKTNKLGGILLKLDFEKAYNRVNWDFLVEVLRGKGFEEGYLPPYLSTCGRRADGYLDQWGDRSVLPEQARGETRGPTLSVVVQLHRRSALHNLFCRWEGWAHSWSSSASNSRGNLSPSICGRYAHPYSEFRRRHCKFEVSAHVL